MEPGTPRLRWCGDSAVSVEFGEAIDPALNARVLALDGLIGDASLPGVVECVPTYRALLVHLDPLATDPRTLGAHLLRLAEQAGPRLEPGRHWRVPVVYGGAFGEDLDALAQARGLAPADLVARHAGARYRVYMIGFMPGFAYLGGLDPELATARRAEPRPALPAGSVIIGGAQTGIASVEAPNAWHTIGRTPVRLFVARRDPPVLLEAGDEVSFEPIAADRFAELDAAAARGDPVARIEPA